MKKNSYQVKYIPTRPKKEIMMTSQLLIPLPFEVAQKNQRQHAPPSYILQPVSVYPSLIVLCPPGGLNYDITEIHMYAIHERERDYENTHLANNRTSKQQQYPTLTTLEVGRSVMTL